MLKKLIEKLLFLILYILIIVAIYLVPLMLSFIFLSILSPEPLESRQMAVMNFMDLESSLLVLVSIIIILVGLFKRVKYRNNIEAINKAWKIIKIGVLSFVVIIICHIIAVIIIYPTISDIAIKNY